MVLSYMCLTFWTIEQELNEHKTILTWKIFIFAMKNISWDWVAPKLQEYEVLNFEACL